MKLQNYSSIKYIYERHFKVVITLVQEHLFLFYNEYRMCKKSNIWHYEITDLNAHKNKRMHVRTTKLPELLGPLSICIAWTALRSLHMGWLQPRFQCEHLHWILYKTLVAIRDSSRNLIVWKSLQCWDMSALSLFLSFNCIVVSFSVRRIEVTFIYWLLVITCYCLLWIVCLNRN